MCQNEGFNVLTSFVSSVSTTASTTSIGYRSLGCWCLSSSIALDGASWSLIDNLDWWLGFLVGIIFMIIAYVSLSSVESPTYCRLSKFDHTKKLVKVLH